MKFIIEVETDEDNTVISAVVKGNVCNLTEEGVLLNKAHLDYPPSDNWLVFEDAHRMIVLSQMENPNDEL